MFIEINGLAYNLMFTQSIDKLYEDGKYKILYAISNENKLVEEFDNEADRDAKYEKAQAVGGASKEEIEHIEDEIEHLKEVGFHPLKVDVLPTEDIKDYILYLVPSDKPGEDNLCYEYLYINNAWEMVGTTSVDLSNYYTKDEVDDKSMFNIVLPNSTLEGNGNIRQEDYQAFLPLLQFLYNKCRGTSRFIRLPLVNINTAHDSSTFYDADNSQLFVVNEQYNKSLNNIHVSLDGIPRFNESGVAKYFSLSIDGNIENDNITSIRSVSIHKSTLPVATKKYVDDNKGQTIQYSSMPTADSTTVGKIVQFTGATNQDYTNGYFYIGTSTTETVDNEEVTTYSWEQLDVQPNSGGGNLPIYQVTINTSGTIQYSQTITDSAIVSQFQPVIQDIFDNGYQDFEIFITFNDLAAVFVTHPRFNRYKITNKPSTGYIMVYSYIGHRTSNDAVAGADNLEIYIYFDYDSSTNTVTIPKIVPTPQVNSSLTSKYFVARNYLAKDNTSSYTPTENYNPATKKYVDDALANIDVSFDDVYIVTCSHRFDNDSFTITDDGSITEMMNTYWPKYLANSNQGGLVIWKDYTGATNGTTLIGYMRGAEIYIQWPWTSQNNGLVNKPYGSVGVVTITGSWDSSTETYTLTKAVWNRTNYVPTKDWNPANKKYVDDNKYTLPVASAETLGGIKIGENLTIDENGVVSASGETIPYAYAEYGFFTGGNRQITDTVFIANVENLITKYLDKSKTIKRIGAFTDSQSTNTNPVYMTYSCYDKITTSMTSFTFHGDTSSFVVYNGEYQIVSSAITVSGTWSGNQFHITTCNIKGMTNNAVIATSSTALLKNNTTAYTPTGDYNPATKKYVDDSISSAITDALGGSY